MCIFYRSYFCGLWPWALYWPGFTLTVFTTEERRLLARKAVQQAMELKDQKQLEAAIARYKDTGVPDDDPVLLKAQKLLTALQAKAGKSQAPV